MKVGNSNDGGAAAASTSKAAQRPIKGAEGTGKGSREEEWKTVGGGKGSIKSANEEIFGKTNGLKPNGGGAGGSSGQRGKPTNAFMALEDDSPTVKESKGNDQNGEKGGKVEASEAAKAKARARAQRAREKVKEKEAE